jgi:hypothetical protein
MHFCPHRDCDYHGWLELGNLRANGHPSGGPWRQFHCTSCHGYFLETHGTLFHGKQAAVELIVRVVACLAEGLGIRATARVFEVDANTVLHWLAEAAEQLRAFSSYFLCDLHLEQLQLDEVYAVLRARKAGKISDKEAMTRLERTPSWVWTAMDPTSKLLVVVEVGHRTVAMAQRVVHQATRVLAPGCVPLFLTDGLKDYVSQADRCLWILLSIMWRRWQATLAIVQVNTVQRWRRQGVWRSFCRGGRRGPRTGARAPEPLGGGVHRGRCLPS